ncbi:MAG: flippase-like domain-containing protein [Deltaproteobacteria bacterium]|nr:flippase-like domain-containing protein [Deltaproteobacteria bacterium]
MKKRISKIPKIFESKARPLIFFLGACVSLACLFFAFRKLNWMEIGREISSMNFWALLGALILVNCHNFLLAGRWYFLLKPLGKLRYWNAFWSLRISFFFNASLPARLGEPFRVFYINRTTKISAARAVGAMGADRFLDFITLCVLLYISAVVLGMRGTLPPTKTIMAATALFIALFVLLTQLPKQSKWRWLNVVLQTRAKIFEGASPLSKWKVLLPTVPISFLGWFIEALIVVAFASALGEPISLFKAFMVVAAVTLAISIPSSPGHIGTFELGAITMLSFLGVPRVSAASIAILYHMVQLIPTLLIGAYGYHFHFVQTEHRKVKTIKAKVATGETDVISFDDYRMQSSAISSELTTIPFSHANSSGSSTREKVANAPPSI